MAGRKRHIVDIVLAAPFNHPHMRRFNGETNCVASHFLRHLENYPANDSMAKVLIDAGDQDVAPRQVDLDIVQVDISFDISALWQLDEHRRKQIYLNTIVEGMSRIAKFRGWNERALFAAKEAVEREALVNRFQVLDPISSPNRKYRATLWALHELDWIEVSIVIVDKRGTKVACHALTRTEPHDMFLVRLLGKLKWVSPDEVVLFDRAGQVVGSVNINQ